MKLSGKTALVTGGARGLGRSAALAMAREGASIVVIDLLADIVEESAEEIRGTGAEALAMFADISNPELVTEAFAKTQERFGRLDILINNAGIAPNRLIMDQSLLEWEQVLRTNLTGTFLCSQAAVPMMEQVGGGAIVNIASTSGQRGATGRSAYGVSKAGIIQLTKIMAVEFAEKNIRVNAIAPGPVDTAITNHSPGTVEGYLSRIPMRRYGTLEAIGAAALFLACDDSSYTTGHVLNVDGGFEAAGLMFPQDEISGAADMEDAFEGISFQSVEDN
ncbi:MAG: SDR family NAD(P)-dependent oxidoreductase [Proteobacteria bacterium]|nr:SDR family NAD(P)-dependent oxidoreductase [Pseudomonadota bacterium]MDA1057042.1 SDR family NAD(P)-dependent oxidoreductase [Pseudomonadota bacterium]